MPARSGADRRAGGARLQQSLDGASASPRRDRPGESKAVDEIRASAVDVAIKARPATSSSPIRRAARRRVARHRDRVIAAAPALTDCGSFRGTVSRMRVWEDTRHFCSGAVR